MITPVRLSTRVLPEPTLISLLLLRCGLRYCRTTALSELGRNRSPFLASLTESLLSPDPLPQLGHLRLPPLGGRRVGRRGGGRREPPPPEPPFLPPTLFPVCLGMIPSSGMILHSNLREAHSLRPGTFWCVQDCVQICIGPVWRSSRVSLHVLFTRHLHFLVS